VLKLLNFLVEFERVSFARLDGDTLPPQIEAARLDRGRAINL
jgi:hypothetical protein